MTATGTSAPKSTATHSLLDPITFNSSDTCEKFKTEKCLFLIDLDDPIKRCNVTPQIKAGNSNEVKRPKFRKNCILMFMEAIDMGIAE